MEGDAVSGGVPWEIGQHPAIPNAWIVRPALFGSRVRVLPECEGGHVLILSEQDARLIAAAPDLLAALQALDRNGHTEATWFIAKKAIAKATGEQP